MQRATPFFIFLIFGLILDTGKLGRVLHEDAHIYGTGTLQGGALA